MSWVSWVALVLALSGFLTQEVPAYVRQGDRVEQEFRNYRDQLNAFYKTLRETVERIAPKLLPTLEGEPPRPVVYGYQLLPKLFDQQPDSDPHPIETRSYSWPLTEGYIAGEGIKLEQAQQELHGLGDAPSGDVAIELQKIAQNYRSLVTDQKTIDQYIEYNRVWQRAIADDRPHFDRLTEVYNMLKQGDPDVTKAIGEALGKPDVPTFIRVLRPSPQLTVVHVPLYTDIEDASFLAKAKSIVEETWRAEDGASQYRVEVELRRISPKELYRNATVPEPGAHLDIRGHVARFPSDGAVLTTGAESTYAGVGRYIALATGDISQRTLAHEFGHVLGFRDGYIRGYRDIGRDGFEILEMTPNFDDIMSAPSRGRVQATHFKLLLASLQSR